SLRNPTARASRFLQSVKVPQGTDRAGFFSWMPSPASEYPTSQGLGDPNLNRFIPPDTHCVQFDNSPLAARLGETCENSQISSEITLGTT
ncbi:MAG: hypothetical protein LW724_11645, partial [Planctomycetaceae bacterium]|nr:hypothetical protein [Planctomycetaceae bacterium]